MADKKSYEELMEEEQVEWHMCKGQQLRPYPMIVCSRCMCGQGSFDVVVCRKNTEDLQQMAREIKKSREAKKES